MKDFTESPVQFFFPAGRQGFTVDGADDAPCGKAPESSPRTQYPLTGGQVSLTQLDSIDNMTILWTKGDNPTRFHQFATYGANTVKDISAGHYCTQGPDFKSLGLNPGDDATMLVIYKLDGQKSKNTYYHCADITLVDPGQWVKPNNYVCGNFSETIDVASDKDSLHLTGNEGTSGLAAPNDDAHANMDGSNNDAHTIGTSSADSAVTTSKGSKLTNAAAGGIGAGVTVAVFLALLGLLFAMGRLHFGKRNVALDDASSTTSSAYATKQVPRQ